MQGIQLFEYKSLLESLNKLKQVDIFNLPGEEADSVLNEEKKLHDIYKNYQLSMQQVSEYIRQFEEHKNAIRRLMKNNRHYLKEPRRKETSNDRI